MMEHDNNHKTNRQTESMTDLPLTTEQADETKAGGGFSGGISVAVGDLDKVRQSSP